MSKSSRDWYHDTWRYERPGFVQDIHTRPGLRREVLKATWFVFNQGTSIRMLSDHLVISERLEEKGRSVLNVCDGEQILDLELQRNDTTEETAAFYDATRFHRIKFEGAHE